MPRSLRPGKKARHRVHYEDHGADSRWADPRILSGPRRDKRSRLLDAWHGSSPTTARARQIQPAGRPGYGLRTLRRDSTPCWNTWKCGDAGLAGTSMGTGEAPVT